MRICQRVAAAFILLLLLPLLTVVALFLIVCMGRPVFFLQERTGLHGKIFQIVKFRTMRIGKDADTMRLTPIGKACRKCSIDELPQLWNIVRGDMNFVGPRPLLPEYLALYSEEQIRRHEVRPGVTGLAQINGRNRISWQERFDLDVWYVDNQSMLLDSLILFKTVMKVFSLSDVSASDHATMEPFKGSPKR